MIYKMEMISLDFLQKLFFSTHLLTMLKESGILAVALRKMEC